MLTRARLALWMLMLVSALAPRPGSVAAQSPTRIGVRVQLVADRFRLKFGPRTPAVEAALAEKVSKLLGEQIAFVRFFPGDTTAPYRLVFTLDRKDRTSAGLFQEYGLWVRLEAPSASPQELYWLMLRPAEATSQGVGSETAFLGEVDAKLSHSNLAPIRKDLLSKVPITLNALAWDNPLGWVLPLGSDSLCMKRFTVLMIINEFTEGGTKFVRPYFASVASLGFSVASPSPAVTPYLRKVFSEPVASESPSSPVSADVKRELQNALRAGTVKAKEVYVTDYQYDPNSCRLQPVNPVGGGRGGGR
jgi:hypothetical protein